MPEPTLCLPVDKGLRFLLAAWLSFIAWTWQTQLSWASRLVITCNGIGGSIGTWVWWGSSHSTPFFQHSPYSDSSNWLMQISSLQSCVMFGSVAGRWLFVFRPYRFVACFLYIFGDLLSLALVWPLIEKWERTAPSSHAIIFSLVISSDSLTPGSQPSVNLTVRSNWRNGRLSRKLLTLLKIIQLMGSGIGNYNGNNYRSIVLTSFSGRRQ